MSIVIDQKYFSEVNPSLGKVRTTKEYSNFRCPICGDSQNNKSKRRGYILVDYENDRLRYYCHNCGINLSFKEFLEHVDVALYNKYLTEIFRPLKTESIIPTEELLKENSVLPLEYMKRVDTLLSVHPAQVYLRSRQIPKKNWDRVYYTSKFTEMIHYMYPERYDDVKLYPDERILFPLYDEKKELVGIQGRAIDPDTPKDKRFIIVSARGTDKGYFGIDKHLMGHQTFILEGCIDSLCLPNSIATCNANLSHLIIKDAIYVPDCEPRNKEVCSFIRKMIDKGCKTVLLPSDYEGMDVNDLITKKKMTETEIINLLNSYSVSGLQAKIKFSKWVKI